MAKYTEHLRLVKPEGNEYYNVEQFNQNSELIDKETKKLSEGLAKVQEGATREKAGIVQFGTEEGKALEGMMLARLAGAYGYGGDIQDEGVKNPNYIYYDRNTRKIYKCLKQNQDISANVTNFIPLDNNSLLEKLENLFKNELLFNGTAERVGTILMENIPDWVKTLKIQGSNDNSYYFQDVFISLNLFENNKNVSVDIGPVHDTKVYTLSLIGRTLKIVQTHNAHNTADNNYIRKIYGLNY